MQAVSRSMPEQRDGEAASNAPAASAIGRWLRRETQADNVRVNAFSRLPGGAIQDNWMLDVDIEGGAWAGQHGWVVRTDAVSTCAASLTRAQEFAVLRLAYAGGVIAPRPLFLCRDVQVIGREFFVMQRLPGVA